ncbi:MAG TPA: protein kinase [Anaerolineaceae bacterium]|nr:protein kinase [Anaerolineaceae bacterium]
MTLQVGTVLYNRYEILDVIAQGGMGAIYRATDQSLGVQVAVKENLFTSEESTRQFRREATILAGLRHSNLPRVTDHFVIPGRGQYLVMDYIEGEDLRQRLNRQELFSENEVVTIGSAICDALNYLHSRQPQIVHRDIKPGNIKITPGGQIHLVDFGLAKLAQPGQATTTGAQALTPGYASPEQYGQGTDSRSDIYSLGATLYAALTNKVPEDALARAMGTAELTPLQQHNPSVSERLATVIEKAMRTSPGERYQTAEEFKQALINSNSMARRKATTLQNTNGYTQNAQTTQGAISQTFIQQPVAKATKKIRPLPFILGGLALIAIVAIGIVVSSGGGNAPVVLATNTQTAAPSLTNTPGSLPPSETPQPTSTHTPQQTETPTATPEPTLTFTPTIQVTPIGGGLGQVAFVSDRSGSAQIYLVNSDGNGLKQITNMADGACQPSWSPDGQRLVIVSPCKSKLEMYRGTSLFLINADGSGITPLGSMPGGDFDPAWSPDGKRIAFSTIRDGDLAHIYIYDLETNKATRITPTSTYDHRPTWSPDGKMLAFESTSLGKPQIFTIDLETGKQREFTILDTQDDHSPVWSPDGQVIVFHIGNREIAIKQYGDRNAIEVIIAPETGPSVDADFSPDGYWLAYENWRNGNHDIFIMTRNGGGITQLTDDPALDFQPAWRP